MAEKPVQEIMASSLEKIRDLVDSNTVIGSPIHTQDGTTILPISKISFGFVSGGTDFATKHRTTCLAVQQVQAAALHLWVFLLLRKAV